MRPPLGNPVTRCRTWIAEHRAEAEIIAIAGVAIGLIIIMLIVTIIVLVRTLR